VTQCTVQKPLNRSSCHLEADSCGSWEPCMRWGSRLGVHLAHWKALAVSAALYTATWIIYSSIPAWQCDCHNLMSHYIVQPSLPPRWKSAPVMRPFVKILWLLLLLLLPLCLIGPVLEDGGRRSSICSSGNDADEHKSVR